MIPANFTFPVVATVNGKIHIMGGGGVGGATTLHYAYDPGTDTWESRADVPYAAQQPAGSAANGKIHFFGGGFPNSGSPLDDHYIYDVASDSWEQAADLTAPRAIHYSVALNDIVFSLAGQGMTNLCQTYDPVANQWITMNNLPDGSFFYGAHVVAEGHIYRFCGGGFMAPNDNVHRYDSNTDTWTSLTDFPTINHGLRGAAIGDKIFLAGGYYDFLERDEVWIFDTQTEEYSPGIPLPLGRNYHNMVTLDSCIYVVGGYHAIDETVRTQLLRLCPYDIISSLKESNIQQTFSANYYAGKISLHLPQDLFGASQLFLFDLAGRLVFSEKHSMTGSGKQETWVGDLPTSIYLVQLTLGQKVFTTKIFIN